MEKIVITYKDKPVIEEKQWMTAAHYIYASIIPSKDETIRVIPDVEDMFRKVYELFYGELMKIAFEATENAINGLAEQNKVFQERLLSSAPNPLISQDRFGLVFLDEPWRKANVIGGLMLDARWNLGGGLVVTDKEPIILNKLFLSVYDGYPFKIYDKDFTSIQEYVFYELCRYLNPDFKWFVLQPKLQFDKELDLFFKKRLGSEIPVALRAKPDIYNLLEQVRLPVSGLDSGFLSSYTIPLCNRVYREMKEKLDVYSRIIRDYEERGVFTRWVDVYQIPAVVENCRALSNLLRREKIVIRAKHVEQMFAELFPCPSNLEIPVPPQFTTQYRYEIGDDPLLDRVEIIQVAWNYIAGLHKIFDKQQFDTEEEMISKIFSRIRSTHKDRDQIMKVVLRLVVFGSKIIDPVNAVVVPHVIVFAKNFLQYKNRYAAVEEDEEKDYTTLLALENISIQPDEMKQVTELVDVLYYNFDRLTVETRSRLEIIKPL